MALEIKGLKANMLKVRARVESLNAKAIAFDDLGAKLESDMDAITEQVSAHIDDLGFASSVLGNSTSETTSEKQQIGEPETGKLVISGEPMRRSVL